MSLLISPIKCPKCGKMSVYLIGCSKCDWVNQEFLDWEKEEFARLERAYKKWIKNQSSLGSANK